MRTSSRALRRRGARHQRRRGSAAHVPRRAERPACRGDRRRAVFDIGGGSTEVVVGRTSGPPRAVVRGELRRRQRAADRAARAHDPPTADELHAVSRAARGRSRRCPRCRGAQSPVGIAGTMTTLAAVALASGPLRRRTRARAHRWSRRRLRPSCIVSPPWTSRRGATCPAWSRSAQTSSSPAAGSRSRCSSTGTPTAVRISDRGVRWGLAEELVALEHRAFARPEVHSRHRLGLVATEFDNWGRSPH